MTKEYTLSELKKSLTDVLKPDATDEDVYTTAKIFGVSIVSESLTPGIYLDEATSIVVVSEDGSGYYSKTDGSKGGYLRADDVRDLIDYITPAITVPKSEWLELVQRSVDQSERIRDLRQARDNWAEEYYKARDETRRVAQHLCKEN